MNNNDKFLFLEIKQEKLIFFAGEYDDNLNFKIIEKITEKAEGFENGKVINLDQAHKVIHKNLEKIEKITNYTFSKINIVTDQKNFDCINISGFKKLKSSQILKEDIEYLINISKRLIHENNEDKSIIHLFNSKFNLDNSVLENLPIGLYGEFYNHQLTFFLLKEIDLKNLRLLFRKCNLTINRIILKSFIEGIGQIKNNSQIKKFCNIKIGKNQSHISIFDNSSYVFSEFFNFGTNMIINDLSKVCSLKHETVINFISNIIFDDLKISDKDFFLDQKYLKNENFRKISHSLLKDIIDARITEIINLIYNKNVNLYFIKNELQVVFIELDDKIIFNSLKDTIIKKIESYNDTAAHRVVDNEEFKPLITAAELISKGWSKEAIPVKQAKKSIISRFFSTLFN
jgi:cell division protein FtsA